MYSVFLDGWQFPITPSKLNVSIKGKNKAATSAPKAKTYTVKKGDSLWAITKRYTGNGARYNELYNANRSIIKNPNLIYPGQVLTLPW